MPRENSKCRKWEKERRDRLKEGFTNLAKALPCYDPSINFCKIDILQKAANSIQELQEQTKHLLSSDTEKKSEKDVIIKQLQDRVKKLLVRNEQLSNLLRDAGITVPSACGTIKKFKKQLLWSKRISPEQAELRKNEMEKENIASKTQTKKKLEVSGAKTVQPNMNRVEPKNRIRRSRKKKGAPMSNCYIVLSQTVPFRSSATQQYYLITTPPNSNIIKNTVKSGTNSKSPGAKSKPKPLKSTISPASTLPPLGPGTLILGNGVAVPVLPQPQPLLPSSTNLILNPTLYTIPKVVAPNDKITTTKTNSTSTKALPFIRPKYCLTRTTQVNKVPIPALTSPYASNYCLFNDKVVSNSKKEVVKPRKTNKKLVGSSKSEPSFANKRKSDSVATDASNKKSKNDQENVSTPTEVVTDTSNRQSESCKAATANVTNEVVAEQQNDCSTSKNSETQPQIIETAEVLPRNVEAEPKITGDKSGDDPKPVLVASSTATTITANTQDEMKTLEMNLPHSELSNDIFASLQVPSGCQNPESTSPTAAFLLAFPLVSSGVKVTEVIDGENESQSVTPTLLQIGTMDTTKCTQSQSDVITSSFLNLDNFSFFNSKDICSGFDTYQTTVGAEKPQEKKIDTVKSTCVKTTTAEPVKRDCNIFCKKAETVKDVGKNDKLSNNAYSLQVHPSSKSDANFTYPKISEAPQKTTDLKTQYNVATTYPNTTCHFNYRDLSKAPASSACTYANIGNKNYTNPLYTNCSSYNYNYHTDTNFNQNYYKNIPRSEAKSYYPINYDNYPDYRKNDSGKYYDSSVYGKEKKASGAARAKTTTETKQPINWMTTPDNRLQTSECLLAPFTKNNFSQAYPFTSYVTTTSSYFPTNTIDTTNMNCALEAKKCLDLPIVSLNSHVEEKQFSWSPTKLPSFLDPPHTFVSSTLPTLVGDLALGNTLPFTEQKNEYKAVKENKDYRQVKANNYENPNFLSVSQLVDHNKQESIPAKASTRRNSGNRSKSTTQQKPKRVAKQDKDVFSNEIMHHQSRPPANNYNAYPNPSIDLFPEQKSKSLHKNPSNSYSAEALIGQVPEDTTNKRYPPVANKASSFLAENIISYFPPVDLPPQDNYMAQNQNYQTNNFTHNLSTSFQNNTYSSNSFIYTASTIASSYLGANSFDPGPHDYLPDLISAPTKDNKHYGAGGKNCKPPSKDEKLSHPCVNNAKRAKKKPSNDALFEFPFLPIPGSNNSPILPDDFHSHTNFLAPTTPFTCKNSLYPKQNGDITSSSLLPLPAVCRSNIQHPDISPSINAVGTSLTNFNLSTIFPEINKGPISDTYQDARIKDHLHQKFQFGSPSSGLLL